MKKKRNLILIPITILLIILFLALILFLIRFFSEKQIDDVSPEIDCERTLLEKSDILFVIPDFNNKSIAENKEFCNYILSLNKKLALHGLTHEYKEFSTDKNEDYLEKAISIFKECFNQSPSEFKAPQLAISENNKKLIKNKMKLDSYFNQIIHKTYHCGDTGKFPNWLIDIF